MTSHICWAHGNGSESDERRKISSSITKVSAPAAPVFGLAIKEQLWIALQTNRAPPEPFTTFVCRKTHIIIPVIITVIFAHWMQRLCGCCCMSYIRKCEREARSLPLRLCSGVDKQVPGAVKAEAKRWQRDKRGPGNKCRSLCNEKSTWSEIESCQAHQCIFMPRAAASWAISIKQTIFFSNHPTFDLLFSCITCFAHVSSLLRFRSRLTDPLNTSSCFTDIFFSDITQSCFCRES